MAQRPSGLSTRAIPGWEISVVLTGRSSCGADKHGRMPYRVVPQDVWDDDDAVLEWAQLSADIARH